MAIHQRGFQWQAITRPADSSACCLCYCRSLALPNSPWKQYLYIYYIFTQYLPCCKTISYLTINLPGFFFSSLNHVSFQLFLLPASVSLYFSFFKPFFLWVVFFSFHASIKFFFQKGFFFYFFFLSFFSPCISMKLDFSGLPWRTITAAIAIS